MIVSEREARDMLEEIEKYANSLNEWELGFVDNASHQEHNLSYGQLEAISRIHDDKVR